MTNWKKKYELAHYEHGEMIDRFDALYCILKEHGIESEYIGYKWKKRTESARIWRRQEA